MSKLSHRIPPSTAPLQPTPNWRIAMQWVWWREEQSLAKGPLRRTMQPPSSTWM